MSGVLAWLLLASLSVHACTARKLIVHGEASSDVTVFSSTSSEDEAGTQDVDGSLLGAITSCIKHSLLGGHPLKQEKDDKIKEGMKKTWRGRALIAGKNMNMKKKKKSNVSGDEAEEEEEEENTSIVMMDYAQPHRKPPIHNEKH